MSSLQPAGSASNNARISLDSMGVPPPARPLGSRGHSDSDVIAPGSSPRDPQILSEVLQGGHAGGTASGSQPSAEARRNTLMALDRKRRLTTSDDSPRRRSITGVADGHSTSSSRPDLFRPLPPPPSPPRLSLRSAGSTRSDNARLGGDRSPTATPRRRSLGVQRTSSYALPRWQPDSEVTKCPICETQFTFWYRKHHCRKCGRVVCASCSPHRITNPRQFIVHPPDQSKPPSTLPPPRPTSSTIIDLTGEGENQRPEPSMSTFATQRQEQHLGAGLGGGEEVRLCNPCVPDPNPEPPRDYSNDQSLHGRSVHQWTNGIALDRNQNPLGPRNALLAEHLGRGPPRGWDLPHHRPHYSMPSNALPPIPRELRRQRGRGMTFQPEGRNLDAAHTGEGEIPEEGLPGYGRFDYTVVPEYRHGPPGYTSNSSSSAVPQWSPPGYFATAPGAASSSAPRPNAPIHVSILLLVEHFDC